MRYCSCSYLNGLVVGSLAAAAGQCAHGQCCNGDQSDYFLFRNISPPKSFVDNINFIESGDLHLSQPFIKPSYLVLLSSFLDNFIPTYCISCTSTISNTTVTHMMLLS